MERRDIGYILAYIYSFIFIAIIGISFSAFLDAKRKISIENIAVAVDDGILVQNLGDKGNQSVDFLQVKSPKVGTKPVSGDLDTQTDIPYTVSDVVGSEGAYAKFQVKSDQAIKIVLEKVEGVPQSQLNNVKLAIVNSKNKPHSLSDIGETIEQKDPSNELHKFTLLIWLDQHAGSELIGSKIKIYLKIVAA